MPKILTPYIAGVFCHRSSANGHLCRLFAILCVINIASEIGSCGDDSQNPPSGSSIVIKENNPSGVPVNVKAKTPFNELISGIDAQTTVPRVVLNLDSSLEKPSPSNVFHAVQRKDDNINHVEKPGSTLSAALQTPSAPDTNIVRSQYPKLLVASKSDSPREPSSPRMAALPSKSAPDRITLYIPPRNPQPASQSNANPTTNSAQMPAAQIASQPGPQPATSRPAAAIAAQQPVPPVLVKPADQIVARQVAPPFVPKPAEQIVFQQTAPSINAQPASLSVNSQIAPAPAPQMAMATPVRQVRKTDADNKKDNNNGQSNQAPVPAQEGQSLPQPPAIEGPVPQPENAAPTTPAIPSDQKLGEAPPDHHLEFLREQTVLLKPCEWQLDVGLTYLHADSTFTDIVPPNQLVEAHIRQRLLYVPLGVRYGLCDRVQLFANAPLGWANSEVSEPGAAVFFNNGGIGDTNAGATIQFQKSDGRSCCPDVLATFGMTAPTGRTNGFVSILETPGTTLGQGFWAGYWNVLVIHTYDPVVVFYGVGSRHFFTKDILDIPAKPGDQYLYQFGTGFAINERITLSTTFFGYYITDAWVNNRVVDGTILEPMYLRFAVTITRCNNRIIEPFATIGMTDAAANAQVGITWTF
jgi:hypothetical protein